MDVVEIHRCAQGSIILPSGGTRRGGKLDDEVEVVAPPALPPRPPPRPRNPADDTNASGIDIPLRRRRVRKYVFLCTVCGGLASLLGSLFLAVYLILRTYTSSLDYFETIPTYIPAAMLMVTGLAVMCLARRRNRYVFLIKLCGLCCLICAGTCVLVTVTTTVVHMSRLQSLRECVYTLKTQTCTCYSVLLESASERTDEGTRYVFNSTPDCEVIHGALYSCLRALFGLSVIGILVCIFCCMLVYQLLSHERKKMYWEQLELRCRYLYGQAPTQARATPSVGQTVTQPVPQNPQATQHCACCQQFRYQQDVLAWEPTDNRFWTPGRVGNLYSPNPVGEECSGAATTAQGRSSGWSWRRLPWSRQSANNVPPPAPSQQRESAGYQRPLNCSSPDSQYGFSSSQGGVATVSSGTASYTMIDPVAQSNTTPGCQVYQWGPPPPYSDPNSPARRVLCPPGPHHHHCQGVGGGGVRSGSESRQAENYVNTAPEGGEGGGDEGSSSVFSNDESCRTLPLRIPTRKTEIPPSSSSSSVKSNPIPNSGDGECSRHQRTCQRQDVKPLPRREENLDHGNCRGCNVSPRVKYLQNRQQNTSENTNRKRVQELTESEVYFADVSSCCNVSVRNDSMSLYDEALEPKSGHNGERILTMTNVPFHQHHHRPEQPKKQPRFVPSHDTKLAPLQMVPSNDGVQKRSECHQIAEEVMSFQRVPSPDECSYSEMALDGSEEDDPELVSFSRQRQTSLRNRMPAFRPDDSNRTRNDQGRNPVDTTIKNQDDFPSPMSISSPSTASKDTGGFYAEAVNSDNGSSDSVWSGYSPDFLAPDAQYETIPEHRMIPPEDLNGNPNDNCANRGNAKIPSPAKRRLYLPTVGESWAMGSNNYTENIQDVPEDRQRYHGNNINSPKSVERARGIVINSPRVNERRVGNIVNSPKPVVRTERSGNSQTTPDISERRRGELVNTGRICERIPSSNNEILNQRGFEDNENRTCERLSCTNSPGRGYDRICSSNNEILNSPKVSERCCDVITNSPKMIEHSRVGNTNINSSETCSVIEETQCCHIDNNCRCYNDDDNVGRISNDQTEVRSVDV